MDKPDSIESAPLSTCAGRKITTDATATRELRMPRQTKLTPDLQERILNMIRLGNYRNVAAQAVGIAPETFSRWMSRPHDPYRQFRQAVEQAEAMAEVSMVALIAKAARDDPKYALQYLARKAPERWAQRRFDGTLGANGKPTEPTSGVLVVPGLVDEKEWVELAERYKRYQPTIEVAAD